MCLSRPRKHCSPIVEQNQKHLHLHFLPGQSFRPSKTAWPAHQPGPQGLPAADALPASPRGLLHPFLISAGPHHTPALLAGSCAFRSQVADLGHCHRVSSEFPKRSPTADLCPSAPFRDLFPGEVITLSHQDCLRGSPAVIDVGPHRQIGSTGRYRTTSLGGQWAHTQNRPLCALLGSGLSREALWRAQRGGKAQPWSQADVRSQPAVYLPEVLRGIP